MKELLEKLGKSVKTTYKEVTEQTQITVDQTKARAELTALKNDLKKLYQKLGECYYEFECFHTEFDSNLLIEDIIKTKHKISTIEEEIQQSVQTQKGNFAHYKDDIMSTWQTEEAEQDVEVKHIKLYKFCGECNAGNPPQNTECSTCGAKIG